MRWAEALGAREAGDAVVSVWSNWTAPLCQAQIESAQLHPAGSAAATAHCILSGPALRPAPLERSGIARRNQVQCGARQDAMGGSSSHLLKVLEGKALPLTVGSASSFTNPVQAILRG